MLAPIFWKRRALLLARLAFYVSLSQSVLTGPGSGLAAADSLIPNETFKLKNGMRVILHEDHRAPFVAVQVTYRFGPLYESPPSRGLAHLFEHLLESYAEHLPRSPAAYLWEAGAVQLRSRLTPDRTDFWSVVPSANLATALWVESDRMGFALPAVDKEIIAFYKKAIELEARLRLSSEPYAMGDDRLLAAMFPDELPVDGNWRAIVPSATRVGELNAPFKKWYAPSNACLVLAGDFTREAALRLISKYFATLPSAAPPDVLPVHPAVIEREVLLRQAEPVARRPRLKMTWLTPALGRPGGAAAELLALILDRGYSGRLHQEIVQTRGLALDVLAAQIASPRPQLLISVSTEQEAVLPQLAQSIDAVLAKLASTEVSPEELIAVKRRYRNQQLLQLPDILQKAHLLQDFNHNLGDPNGLELALAEADKVTAAELRQFVRDSLDPSHRIVLYSTVAQQVQVSGRAP